MNEYYRRVVESKINDLLESSGAVLIEGPKWCGKTTTAIKLANSVVYMQDPLTKTQNIELAKVNPLFLLAGLTPRLIDEWQLVPGLWDSIRHEVDQRGELGQFLLTGSSVPFNPRDMSHSGIGRIARVLMRTMSLFESRDSNGSVSLKGLFDGSAIASSTSELDINRYAFLVCRGGWPSTVDRKEKIALQQAFNYFDGLVSRDINETDGVPRNQDRLKRFLRSYARHIATQATIATIKTDMSSNEANTLDEDTISSYIGVLKRMFVIEDMSAWNPNLRSQTTIRTADTRHFIDPSIACASLGIGPEDLINDLKTFGLFFESLCIRDLRVYSQALDGNVYHYRDRNDLECDAVIHLRNGNWGAVEVKLGHHQVDEAARTLLKLKSQIDTDKMKAPSFLMILTGTQYAYRREDGVYVVPIGCLRD